MKQVILLFILAITSISAYSFEIESNSPYLKQCKSIGQATTGVIVPAQNYVIETNAPLSGWVKLSFDILKDGSVSSVKVIDSKPNAVFNRWAVITMRRTQCLPVIDNGKAIVVKNQIVKMHFVYPRKANKQINKD